MWLGDRCGLMAELALWGLCNWAGWFRGWSCWTLDNPGWCRSRGDSGSALTRIPTSASEVDGGGVVELVILSWGIALKKPKKIIKKSQNLSKLVKISQNWPTLVKIGLYWSKRSKLVKTCRNWSKLVKIYLWVMPEWAWAVDIVMEGVWLLLACCCCCQELVKWLRLRSVKLFWLELPDVPFVPLLPKLCKPLGKLSLPSCNDKDFD